MTETILFLDQTHSPKLRSWVESANDGRCNFPIQNLPIAIFRRAGSAEGFRGGVAIGDAIIDLSAPALAAHLKEEARAAIQLAARPTLNAFMAAGRTTHRKVRNELSRLLRADFADRRALASAIVPLNGAEFSLPAEIGGFSDFYCSVYHAENVGKLFRPTNPLLPNYRWLPVGYAGRTSSILLSGTPVRRPNGQTLKPNASDPTFGPCQRLDYEAELGFFVGKGNELGDRVEIDEVETHLFGVCLLNDWSARDIQSWEYQPLGPFLAKSFGSSISPWVVTFDALEPYRKPHRRPSGDPAPMPHLTSRTDPTRGAIDIKVEVHLLSSEMQIRGISPVRLSRSTYADAYWTLSQVFAHHTSNGCNLEPGDLLGSGTLSGPDKDERACLLELTEGGKSPVVLPTGETRAFLENGDTLIMSAYCEADGFARIGFGECRGTVLPAK